MSQLLDEWRSCDGYRIRAALSNGETLTFRFNEQPVDTQAAVDALESDHLARLQAEVDAEIVLEIVPE